MDNKFDYLLNKENFFNGKINEVSVSVVNDDFESDPIDYKIDIKKKDDHSICFVVDYDLNISYIQ